MIGWDELYKVLSAMVPLYVALALGYGSVKWWHMFTPDHCDAINRLNCYFIIPLFTFDFTTRINPFQMNYRFIAADAISKSIILLAITLWANCTRKGNFSWSITSFSLSSLNNTLVVGVPLMKAMYGSLGEDLVIQSSILQSIIWVMILLFMLEFQRAKADLYCTSASLGQVSGKVDIEENNQEFMESTRPALSVLMKTVGRKLARNPNSYACILGLAWALISNRWNIQMPSIMQGSVQIMSRAGSGVAMFCMGLFMALQEKIIDCGVSLTVYGMVLRFIAAPATMALGSIAVGLHADALRISIIQAALPQSIASFVFAKEYGLHANVLSTAVIFGTIVSLPTLIAYYAALDLLR